MAAARVGRDVDTAGFDEERRIRSASPESLPPVPGRASVAAIEMYWDDVHGEAFDETRTLFHLLVLIVLTHDTRQQGCFDQALNLIELGAQKPYLVYTCALHLRFERAPLIAWLLTRPSLVAFAVSLLAELRITEPTMMDEWEKREARKHVRRGVLFREALALAMRTATTSSGGAELMIDVLRGLARRCHRSSLDSAQAISAAKHNEELFALAVSHITEARMERVTVAGRPDYEPLLLADRFEDVVDLLAKDFPDDEVTEQIRVGLELLRFVRERVGAFAHRATGVRDGLERRLTDLLTERYKAALALDAANDAFRHFVASPSLALLPWEHLVAGLQSAGAESLDAWMNTPELTRMLKESDTIATEHERHDVVAGVVARLRSHLAVFLRVYDHLDETPCDDREALKRTFEKEIERLVLARVDAGGA